MRKLKQFGQFWVNFIIGDAWEIAVGLAVTLIAIWLTSDHIGGDLALSFVLLTSLLALMWVTLLRTTRASRKRR